MRRPKPKHRLIAGTLEHYEEDWCETHMSATVYVGYVYFLTPDGVTLWGVVSGCIECEDWIWTDTKGIIHDVRNDWKANVKKED